MNKKGNDMISQRMAYLIGFIIILILIGVGFYLQIYDGITPCPLCILQRMTLGMLGVIFFFGAVVKTKKFGQRFIASFAMIISLLGIFLSARQVWLQHLPFDKNSDCGASLNYLLHVLPLTEVAQKVLAGSAECSVINWQFLHLSLADWSLCWFILLLIFSLLQCLRTK